MIRNERHLAKALECPVSHEISTYVNFHDVLVAVATHCPVFPKRSFWKYFRETAEIDHTVFFTFAWLQIRLYCRAFCTPPPILEGAGMAKTLAPGAQRWVGDPPKVLRTFKKYGFRVKIAQNQIDHPSRETLWRVWWQFRQGSSPIERTVMRASCVRLL